MGVGFRAYRVLESDVLCALGAECAVEKALKMPLWHLKPEASTYINPQLLPDPNTERPLWSLGAQA